MAGHCPEDAAPQIRPHCGTSAAAQVRHKCGTAIASAEQVWSNKCGASAEQQQVRSKCGASAENSSDRVRNAGGCVARRLLAKTPPKKHKNTPKSTKTPKKTGIAPFFFAALPGCLRVGTRADPLRNGGGTGAAPVRHRCGTGADRVQNGFGTGAERVRNAGGTPADLRRGVLCHHHWLPTALGFWSVVRLDGRLLLPRRGRVFV